MLVLVLVSLFVAISADFGTVTWGQQCNASDVANNYGCIQGLSYCQTNCPAAGVGTISGTYNPPTRTYTACFDVIAKSPPNQLFYVCSTSTSYFPVGYSLSNGGWSAWCRDKQGACYNLNSPYGYCNPSTRLCEGGVVGQGGTNCTGYPTGGELVEGGVPAEMPVSSAVALIFLAFFVGIIISYVVYKFRKMNSRKYVHADTAQALSESSRQSAEDSHLGERPLNVAPLSEQV